MEKVKGTEGFNGFVEVCLRSENSLQCVMEAQRELLHNQIEELQKIVFVQCRLTGINPLAQEMAAGALNIKIGRRPRDLLTPKAIKCLQGVFAIKDTVTKREAREISALCGATITQVREFFSGQRSRVRRLVRQAHDKTNNIQSGNTPDDGVPSAIKQSGCLTTLLHYPNAIGIRTAGKDSCRLPDDKSFEDRESFDTNFIRGFFFLMRKEGTFSGQVQLLERILQIHDSTVLCWFVTKGGIPILSKWLSQASVEEQTTVLQVIFKVLCHLPLHKALPVQMSTILQTVNKLRFYRTSDISNRARVLLTRWSKLFVKSPSGRKATSSSFQVHAQKGGLQGRDVISSKKRVDDSSREENHDNYKRVKEDSHECMKMKLVRTITGTNSPRQSRLLQSSVQTLDSECSKKRPSHALSLDQTKERRKVLLVEDPTTVMGRRKMNIGVISKTCSRPLSADDIQKAKRRAQLLKSRNSESDILKVEDGHLEKAKPSESGVTRSFSHRDRKKAGCSKAGQQESSILEVPLRGCQDSLQDVNSSNLVEETIKNVPIHLGEFHNPIENQIHDTGKSLMIQEPSLIMNEQFRKIHILKDNLEEETGKNLLVQEASLTMVEQFVAPQIYKENFIDEPLSRMSEQFGMTPVPWVTPPEMRIDPSWRFASGQESKEVEFQSDRVKREKESVYANEMSIPSEPKEPWDIELDYDDSLTLEIPLEPIATEDGAKLFSQGNDERQQLQEIGKDLKIEGSASFTECHNQKIYIDVHKTVGDVEDSSCRELNSDSWKQVRSNGEPGPDLELLAVLLKNPDLVFALTSEQGARFNKAETVALLDLLKATGPKQESFCGVSSFASNKQDIISSSGSSNAEVIKYEEPLMEDSATSASILHSVQRLAEQISTAAEASSIHMLPANHENSTNSLYRMGHGDSNDNGPISHLLKKQKLSPPHDCVSQAFVFPQDTEQALVWEAPEKLYRSQDSWLQEDTANPPSVVPLVRPVLTANKDFRPEYVRFSSTSQLPNWPLVHGQNDFKDANISKHGFGVSTLHSMTVENDLLKTINKVPSSDLSVAQPTFKHSPLNGTSGPLPVMIPAGKPTKQSTSQALLPRRQPFVRQGPMHQGHIRAPNSPVSPGLRVIESMQTSSSNGAGFTQGGISERGDHIDRIRSLVMDFGRDTGMAHARNSFSANSQGHGLRTNVLPPPSNYPNNVLPPVQPNLVGPEPVEWFHSRRPHNYSQSSIMPRPKNSAPRNTRAPNVGDDGFHPAHNLSHRTMDLDHSNQLDSFQLQGPWGWTGRRAPPRSGWR
ncbi:hypothetical protein SUGI_0972100 [Cryptomeria japonica]|uniref:homeobox protein LUMINIDEPENDENS isoform X2 n=1 Tax=Cryptomeria japonica TaxID=3369 RepID=UPI002414C9B7|nr:homeobox protein LUMINIDEPENDENS isoform X2 [Cryptomeria japonica]GLJ46143.1 hypothetical protein SUGI_0972100 [Cryptomeria japonica]